MGNTVGTTTGGVNGDGDNGVQHLHPIGSKSGVAESHLSEEEAERLFREKIGYISIIKNRQIRRNNTSDNGDPSNIMIPGDLVSSIKDNSHSWATSVTSEVTSPSYQTTTPGPIDMINLNAMLSSLSKPEPEEEGEGQGHQQNARGGNRSSTAPVRQISITAITTPPTMTTETTTETTKIFPGLVSKSGSGSHENKKNMSKHSRKSHVSSVRNKQQQQEQQQQQNQALNNQSMKSKSSSNQSVVVVTTNQDGGGSDGGGAGTECQVLSRNGDQTVRHSNSEVSKISSNDKLKKSASRQSGESKNSKSQQEQQVLSKKSSRTSSDVLEKRSSSSSGKSNKQQHPAANNTTPHTPHHPQKNKKKARAVAKPPQPPTPKPTINCTARASPGLFQMITNGLASHNLEPTTQNLLIEMQEKMNRVNREQETCLNEIKMMNQEMEKYRTDTSQKLKEREITIRTYETEIDSLKQQIVRSNTEHQEDKSAAHTETRNLLRKVSTLQNRLMVVEQERDAAIRAALSADDETDDNGTSVASPKEEEMKETIQDLLKQIEDSEEEHQREQTMLNEEIMLLRRKLERLESEYIVVERERDDATQKLEAAEQKIEIEQAMTKSDRKRYQDELSKWKNRYEQEMKFTKKENQNLATKQAVRMGNRLSAGILEGIQEDEELVMKTDANGVTTASFADDEDIMSSDMGTTYSNLLKRLGSSMPSSPIPMMEITNSATNFLNTSGLTPTNTSTSGASGGGARRNNSSRSNGGGGGGGHSLHTSTNDMMAMVMMMNPTNNSSVDAPGFEGGDDQSWSMPANSHSPQHHHRHHQPAPPASHHRQRSPPTNHPHPHHHHSPPPQHKTKHNSNKSAGKPQQRPSCASPEFSAPQPHGARNTPPPPRRMVSNGSGNGFEESISIQSFLKQVW